MAAKSNVRGLGVRECVALGVGSRKHPRRGSALARNRGGRHSAHLHIRCPTVPNPYAADTQSDDVAARLPSAGRSGQRRVFIVALPVEEVVGNEQKGYIKWDRN